MIPYRVQVKITICRFSGYLTWSTFTRFINSDQRIQYWHCPTKSILIHIRGNFSLSSSMSEIATDKQRASADCIAPMQGLVQEGGMWTPILCGARLFCHTMTHMSTMTEYNSCSFCSRYTLWSWLQHVFGFMWNFFCCKHALSSFGIMIFHYTVIHWSINTHWSARGGVAVSRLSTLPYSPFSYLHTSVIMLKRNSQQDEH